MAEAPPPTDTDQEWDEEKGDDDRGLRSGCYGCLAALAFFVLIMVFSVIWGWR